MADKYLIKLADTFVDGVVRGAAIVASILVVLYWLMPEVVTSLLELGH